MTSNDVRDSGMLGTNATCLCNSVRAVEGGDPCALFALLVPGRDHSDEDGRNDAFEGAKQEPEEEEDSPEAGGRVQPQCSGPA